MFKDIQISKPDLKPFTKESFQAQLPVKVKVTDEHINTINSIIENEDVAEYYKDNLISFSSVLTSPNMSIQRYLDAVKYVSYILMDYSSFNAWKATFPDKYKRLVDKGTPVTVIQSHVAGYRKNKLVTKVMEQALVPSYIYNATLFQKALNVQANIMQDETILPKDRIAAADSVLKYTQMPENLINNKDEVTKQGLSIIDKLAESINKLSDTQSNLIKDQRVSVKDIAASKIIEGDYEQV